MAIRPAPAYHVGVDPDLAKRVRSGEYVVDAQAVAAAIFDRGGFGDTPKPGARDISDVLIASELDDIAGRAEEIELSVPGDDLA